MPLLSEATSLQPVPGMQDLDLGQGQTTNQSTPEEGLPDPITQVPPSPPADFEPSIGSGAGDVALEDLYPEQPDAVNPDVVEADMSVADVGTPGVAELSPEQQVDAELARITGQDSPLMARARADAAQLANRRGLQNTSMAVGAAEGAMVDRALPMAQQNASQAFNRGVFNADQANESARLQAQMRTALERGDQEAYNIASQQFADAQNRLNEQQMQQVTALNEQYLRGSQAMDLATIQGTYQQLISSNATAGSLYESYFNVIASVMDDPEMTPMQIARAVETAQAMLEASLRMIAEMNNMDINIGDNSSEGEVGLPDEIGGFSGLNLTRPPDWPEGVPWPPTQQPVPDPNAGAGG